MSKTGFFLAAVAAICIVFSSGCSPVVRNRTLPVSIRTVYIPMIRNTTQQPGFEERFTVAFQEEVLADGRLDIVSRRQADAIVDIEVAQFGNPPVALDPDQFAGTKVYKVEARMKIIQNIPGRPLIGGLRDVEAEYVFNDDPRATAFNPEPYEIDQLARVFARECLLELITGEYEFEKRTLLNLGTGEKADKEENRSGLNLPE